MRPTTPSSPSSRVSRELMHVIDLMSEAEPSGIELRHFHTAWYSKRSGHRNAFKGNLAVAWFVANARRLNAFLPKAMAINGAPTAVRLGQHLVDAGHIEHLSGSVSGSSPRKNSDAGHYGGGGGGGAGGMFRNGSDKYRLVPRQGSLVEARVTAETVVELTRRMNRSEVAVHENSSSYASSSRVLRGLVEQQAAIQAEQRSAVTILLVVVCSLLLCMALKELQLYPKAFLARLSDEQAAAARGAGCASAALALAMYVILGRRGGSASLSLLRDDLRALGGDEVDVAMMRPDADEQRAGVSKSQKRGRTKSVAARRSRAATLAVRAGVRLGLTSSKSMYGLGGCVCVEGGGRRGSWALEYGLCVCECVLCAVVNRCLHAVCTYTFKSSRAVVLWSCCDRCLQ